MKIFVAGHKGMVGSAICRELHKQNCSDILVADRTELDLGDSNQVMRFFQSERPDAVILAAARVGGIFANSTYPAQFIYENLQIQTNIIHQAHCADVNKLLFLGSSCIYPKSADQPIKETALLTGSLENTNEPYAISKIAGIKMCESYNREYFRDYRSVMPTNLYGPNDNFHHENSHVLPALIRRFHEAKLNNQSELRIWGDGTPMREFLHVDDMASASLYVLNLGPDIYKRNTQEMVSHVNVGTGSDISIRDLAELLRELTGFKGKIAFDKSKPNGTMRKLLDVQRLKKMGWSSSIPLRAGLESTYEWFLKNQGVFKSS